MRNQNKVFIKFVDTWPEDDIVTLYKAGGWWKESYDTSRIQSLIAGSFAFAVAVAPSSGKAIGMGRLISDGVADAYIQDLVVLPEYRGQGIGKKIVRTLVDRGLSKGLVWIALIAEPGNQPFFAEAGFRSMKDHTPMRYQTEER